jgi:antitoxin (DNA-binding transcriptional repressor) of toxin-antitoxin stability system
MDTDALTETPGEFGAEAGGEIGGEVRVGVRELRGKLTRYLRQARQGTAIIVTSHDDVIAEIRPPSTQRRPERTPGALRGHISMSDDFDRLPDDVLAAMEA